MINEFEETGEDELTFEFDAYFEEELRGVKVVSKILCLFKYYNKEDNRVLPFPHKLHCAKHYPLFFRCIFQLMI